MFLGHHNPVHRFPAASIYYWSYSSDPRSTKGPIPGKNFQIYGRSSSLNRIHRFLTPLVLLVALVAVAGCHKKAKPIPPAETAPAAVTPLPTAQLTATPAYITAGESVQLKWGTTDATTVSIDGIGEVPTSGVKTVTPNESTSFHLVAHNARGTAEATARVTVSAAPVAVAPASDINDEEAFRSNIQDIFFDFDVYDIRADAQATLSHDAAYLASHPGTSIVIGGYCDERGSNEYNLALGQNRADATRKALISAGIAANRIRVISYGKEKPFCNEHNEACWQKNRRAGFTRDK
jgi:peptidoglycan-associated lipoprotein